MFDVDIPRPFSVPQLANRWGCSEGLVRKMIRDGSLQCFRPGTLIRISAAEVERFEGQQQSASMAPAAHCGGASLPSGEEQVLAYPSAVVANPTRKIERARKRVKRISR